MSPANAMLPSVVASARNDVPAPSTAPTRSVPSCSKRPPSLTTRSAATKRPPSSGSMAKRSTPVAAAVLSVRPLSVSCLASVGATTLPKAAYALGSTSIRPEPSIVPSWKRKYSDTVRLPVPPSTTVPGSGSCSSSSGPTTPKTRAEVSLFSRNVPGATTKPSSTSSVPLKVVVPPSTPKARPVTAAVSVKSWSPATYKPADSSSSSPTNSPSIWKLPVCEPAPSRVR